MSPGKADNRILSVTAALRQVFPERQVVLVSKDINMRIKARSLGLPAEVNKIKSDIRKVQKDFEKIYN